MGDLCLDLRYGARTLLKSPGFTLVAVLTLALGLGANTAMFGIVHAVLLRPVPYPEPDSLLFVQSSGGGFRQGAVSYPNFLDWRQRAQSFQQLAAYRTDNFNLTGQAEPERLRGAMASASLFSVLGIRALAGRPFAQQDDQRGAAPVAVITSTLWNTRFGRDATVIGRRITLNGVAYTIVGVVPADDVILSGLSVIVPAGQWSEPLFWDRGVAMGLQVLGRLRPGVTHRQAQAELDSVAAGLAREFPKENDGVGVVSRPLREAFVGGARTPMLVLMAAVGCVLLIACANIANLLLARSAARRREFALRAALGANRARIIRQILAEGLLLSTAGGALGLVVAVVVYEVFVSGLGTLPRGGTIGLNGPVLLFTAGASLLSCLVFGITPAWQSARSSMNEVLKEGARGVSGRHTVQHGFVVAEVALALVLAVSAGLMIRTMASLGEVDPGFDPRHVLVFGVAGSPGIQRSPETVRNGYAETSRQLRAVPGMSAASVLIGSIPMNTDTQLPFWIEGRPKPAGQNQMAHTLLYGIEPDYFSVMRIPLRRGRLLENRDNEANACVIDIDEEFARATFQGQEPLGQHVNFDVIPMQCEVVGVVGHANQWGLDIDAASSVRAQVYIHYRQLPDHVMNLVSAGSAYVVRAHHVPHALVPALRRAVNNVDGTTVMFGERGMEDIIASSLGARRFTQIVLGFFAGLALVLAAVGIYGVTSYAVSRRVHEIGIRQALGADRRRIVTMVLGSAIRVAGVGILIGGAGALAVTGALKGLLFGVTAADPTTFVEVSLVVLVVSVAASGVPAWRATRVDPIVALRCE